MTQLVPVTSTALPALIAACGERAALRFLEFAANIRNPHSSRAGSEFMTRCGDNGVTSIMPMQPLPVSAWIELR